MEQLEVRSILHAVDLLHYLSVNCIVLSSDIKYPDLNNGYGVQYVLAPLNDCLSCTISHMVLVLVMFLSSKVILFVCKDC